MSKEDIWRFVRRAEKTVEDLEKMPKRLQKSRTYKKQLIEAKNRLASLYYKLGEFENA